MKSAQTHRTKGLHQLRINIKNPLSDLWFPNWAILDYETNFSERPKPEPAILSSLKEKR